MRYDRRVAIQSPEKSVDSFGEEHRTYETVAGLESIPAAVVAMTSEDRRANETVVADRYSILLAGVHPEVDIESVVLDDAGRVFEVLAVQPSPFGSNTLLQAQNLTPAGAV